MKWPCIYILTNLKRDPFYTGMTTDLPKRMQQYLASTETSFPAKHGLTRLVYVEFFPTVDEAAAAERKVKRWKRAWKINLVERINPACRNLLDDFLV